MNALRTALACISDALDVRSVRWAVVGGLAVSARSEPRFTRDVDITIAVRSDAEAEVLVFALSALGYSVLATVEQEATKRLATVRLSAPGNTIVVVDLLFASSGIEEEVVSLAERIEVLDGLIVPVASLSSLIALKVLSVSPRRPRDRDDIEALCKEATTGQLQDVSKLLGLIAERGYSRDKNLAAEWNALLREIQSP